MPPLLCFLLVISQAFVFVASECTLYSNCTACTVDTGCAWCFGSGGAWSCQDLSAECAKPIHFNGTCPECESYDQCVECASDSSCTWCQDNYPSSCQSYAKPCLNALQDSCVDYCSQFTDSSMCANWGCTWCHLKRQCSLDELFCVDDTSSSSDGDYLPLFAYVFFALGASILIVGFILGVLYLKRRIEVGPSYNQKKPIERASLVLNDDPDEE